jgi:hypothetical protein
LKNPSPKRAGRVAQDVGTAKKKKLKKNKPSFIKRLKNKKMMFL